MTRQTRTSTVDFLLIALFRGRLT